MRLARLLVSTGLSGLFCLSLVFGLGCTIENAFASEALSQNNGAPGVRASSLPAPEIVTGASINISFAELGYGERELSSPYGFTQYSLRLPQGWEVVQGWVELDLSYTYVTQGLAEDQPPPSFLGEIAVLIDGETQLEVSIEKTSLEHFQLRAPLPAVMPTDSRDHTVVVVLRAHHLCAVSHTASLTIHDDSQFVLDYNRHPLTVDLALYPGPFYQKSFQPDQVRFVLPDNPTEAELAGAAAVAARLGAVAPRLTISGTTSSAFLDQLDQVGTGQGPVEHLILVGATDRHPLIKTLDDLDVLPVSLIDRQMMIESVGPTVVAAGEAWTMTFAVTNTTPSTAQSLQLRDVFPSFLELVDCTPDCQKPARGEVGWTVSGLRPGEAGQYTLTLRSGRVMSGVVDSTLTLFDRAHTPLNVSTFVTRVTTDPKPVAVPGRSVSLDEGMFFAIDDTAVPEEDGVIQELVSPWDPSQAILVITGLDDAAVYKASQAMSSKNQFPGMEGTFAFVREVASLSTNVFNSPNPDMTLANLGYEDRVTEGFYHELTYLFDLPSDWLLVEGTTFDLHFAHSQLFSFKNGESFLTLLFNNKPVATIALDEETAQRGRLEVELPPHLARPSNDNRITIRAEMTLLDRCLNPDLWLRIDSSSRFHFEYQLDETAEVDLALYPRPFVLGTDLSDVLFLLPPEPQLAEWEKVLQVAASLGGNVGGPRMQPAVMYGDEGFAADLAAYHIIVLGRPSRHPVLQQINDQLPLPFVPGTEQIEQRMNQVVFRLPPELDLGLLQLMPSPWNTERALLAITGTTDRAISWAATALDSPWLLKGNLVLVTEAGLSRIDTRGLTRSGEAMAVQTAVPEMEPVPTATVTATVSGQTLSAATATSVPTSEGSATPTATRISERPRQSSRPVWLWPLVGTAAIVVLGIIGVVVRQSFRRS